MDTLKRPFRIMKNFYDPTWRFIKWIFSIIITLILLILITILTLILL